MLKSSAYTLSGSVLRGAMVSPGTAPGQFDLLDARHPCENFSTKICSLDISIRWIIRQLPIPEAFLYWFFFLTLSLLYLRSRHPSVSSRNPISKINEFSVYVKPISLIPISPIPCHPSIKIIILRNGLDKIWVFYSYGIYSNSIRTVKS